MINSIHIQTRSQNIGIFDYLATDNVIKNRLINDSILMEIIFEFLNAKGSTSLDENGIVYLFLAYTLHQINWDMDLLSEYLGTKNPVSLQNHFLTSFVYYYLFNCIHQSFLIYC